MAQNLTLNKPNYIKIRMTNCKTCQNTRLRTLTGMSYLNLTRFLDVKFFSVHSMNTHTLTCTEKARACPSLLAS